MDYRIVCVDFDGDESVGDHRRIVRLGLERDRVRELDWVLRAMGEGHTFHLWDLGRRALHRVVECRCDGSRHIRLLGGDSASIAWLTLPMCRRPVRYAVTDALPQTRVDSEPRRTRSP